MVLQQETEVNLWGTGTPRDSVFVEAEWGQVSVEPIENLNLLANDYWFIICLIINRGSLQSPIYLL